MKVRKILLIVGLLLGVAQFIQGSHSPAMAKVGLAKEAVIQGEATTIRSIHIFFNKAEEALRTGNLDGLMELYSQNYHFDGLTKEDRRRSWKDLFTRYHRISSFHSFSRIVVNPGMHATAKATCTGTLWATDNGTNHRINLAVWRGDLHYLIEEEGQWRISGPGKNLARIAQHGWAPPPTF